MTALRDQTAARPPSMPLYLSEPIRAAATFGTLPIAAPFLRLAPRGDGHAVLVLPGLLASDNSTQALRWFLRGLGYRVQGWGLGRNVGPSKEILAGLPRLLTRLAADGPVSIVGQSLGGVFGRELARRQPELVRQMITLGSPFAMTDSRQSRADRAYRSQAARHADTLHLADSARPNRPIPVPSTAVYSRRDGIVHWHSCIEPESERHENVEVRCGHLGMGVDPATLWIIADRLAQPAGQWRAFVPPRAARRHFPSAHPTSATD
jgi:pimeloyl-ACP methyl ester carboxylesterase